MKTRKIISLLMAILLLVGTCITGAAAETTEDHPDLPAGDADRDGGVSILDATKIQRVIAELDSLDAMSAQVAKNEFSAEELTILDATNIQRSLAELNSPRTYEVGKPAFVWKDGKYISVLEHYKAYFDAWMEKNDYYGVIHITRNGRELYSNARGKVTRAFTVDTLFPIGSISKQFCAAAVMMLQERGLLSVDDKLEKYFPAYEYGKDITLRNLLNMRSGILDFVNQATPMEDYAVSDENTAEQNKKIIMDWLFAEELFDDPDDHFAYSNTNYFLLAEIVEKVSGMKYSDFIKQNIFVPLGMTHSGFYEELFGTDDLAELRLEDFDPMEPHIKGLTQGSGDLVSCAEDMDKWLTSFRTGALLSKESIAEISKGVNGYGFGWNVLGGGILQHFGGIAAYFSSDGTDPKTGWNFFTSMSFVDPYKADTEIRKLTSFVMSITM